MDGPITQAIHCRTSRWAQASFIVLVLLAIVSAYSASLSILSTVSLVIAISVYGCLGLTFMNRQACRTIICREGCWWLTLDNRASAHRPHEQSEGQVEVWLPISSCYYQSACLIILWVGSERQPRRRILIWRDSCKPCDFFKLKAISSYWLRPSE